MKRRRGKMKSHEYCFTAEDAVDVILQFLCNDESRFNQKDMSREKATKVHTRARTPWLLFLFSLIVLLIRKSSTTEMSRYETLVVLSAHWLFPVSAGPSDDNSQRSGFSPRRSVDVRRQRAPDVPLCQLRLARATRTLPATPTRCSFPRIKLRRV